MRIRSRIRRAFTLVELLVVIGIIALLVGVLLPALQKAQEAGKAIACASQMRQIGMAIQMYVGESKGTYPPCWIQDDKAFSPPNPYVGQAGKNRSYATLLLKYVGFPKDDPYQGNNAKIFKCPNDGLERASWLGGGALSYTMPSSWGPDDIFFKQRYNGFGNPPTSGTTLNRGIGQFWNGPTSYPMWIRSTMIKPAPKVLLLVERSYSEQAQTVVWNLGYSLSRPADQMYSAGGAYGFPLLHGRKGKEGQARFNYLYVDNHVEQQVGAETVRDKGTAKFNPNAWEGGDYSWTIQPEKFHQ